MSKPSGASNIGAQTAQAKVPAGHRLPIAGRPHIPNIGPDLERLTAFIVLGGAFSIAYPTRRLQILVAIIAVAITLEVTQILAPSRHGRPHDALVKVAGGLMGIVIAAICDRNKPNG
ncbi:MAG: VanZ family protein [Bosea sp. (in: a-proteobacteria)]|uniref:VanZ family protein n=1 Tax=Bosea sp. (in: a-proteobacteria) TaxID=1871050 RepID=UPI002734AA3E|nr:VanZ family protein [Bosea sp. (in: a-proteobacteria)]MDP3599891.1 VanZ family protein [Bosea sp. (in: a-proteobacteria)]